MYRRTTCRCCLGENLEIVWRLGPTPLADGFLESEDEAETYYPLDVNFCRDCGFLQLADVLPQEMLFPNDYHYYSSTSPIFIKHFEDLVDKIIEEYNPRFVIDIGSNDGILLKPFIKYGVKTLGIEPVATIAKVANDQGIETIAKPFNQEVAREILEFGRADVITATNVFAHIDELDEIMEGVKALLRDDGVFIVEVQYLVQLIEKVQLGLIYHEHLSYWCVRTLKGFFERHGMYIDKFEEIATHNGSIRVYVKKGESKDLDLEAESKFSDIKTYLDFNKAMLKNKMELINLLTKLKLKGKKIVGYGAAAKAMTPLSFFSIGKEILDYIVDDSEPKQGLLSPGKRIPIVPASRLYEDRPDYILLTAWNFAEPIMKKHPDFKYIMPVPKPKLL